MTDEQHNKYIAFTFIANGGFQLLMLLFMAVMFYFILAIGPPGQPGPPMALFGVFFAVMFVIQMVFAAPSFVAAYALLRRKPWARIASIIAAILAAMHVPIGTAAAVYALWFFFGDQWKSVYPQEPADNSSDQRQIPYGESRWDGHVMNKEGEVVYRHQDPPDWR